MARDRMTAASNGDERAALAREAHGFHSVVGASAAGAERRKAVGGTIPDPARLVVALFAWPQQRPRKRARNVATAHPSRAAVCVAITFRPPFLTADRPAWRACLLRPALS